MRSFSEKPLIILRVKKNTRPSFIKTLLVLSVFALSPHSARALTVLWETDFASLPVTTGARVNSSTNPWWTSSSPRSRFTLSEDLLVILAQPGHLLSNLSAIALDPGVGKTTLELLLRNDEPSTLNLTSNLGVFSAPNGILTNGTLEVPTVYASTFQWISFSWERTPQELSSFSFQSDDPNSLYLTVTSVDNPLYIAAARVTFEPISIPEPSRLAILIPAMVLAFNRRQRSKRDLT